MNPLRSLYSCVAGTLYRCIEIEPGRTGTRTRGGLPAVDCPVSPGPLSLPQEDGCIHRTVRSLSRAASQCVFTYRDAPGFDMPFASTISAFLASPYVQAVGQAVTQLRAHQNEAEAKDFAGDRARFNSFEEFRGLLIDYPVPPIADVWRADRAWCDQLLAGFDPISIQRVTSDERGIGADWSRLRSRLNRGVIAAAERATGGSLDAAIAAGRLYVTDARELKNAGPTIAANGSQSGEVPMAPISLFIRAEMHGGLDPVAIQLDQGPESPYYLPDGSADWLIARSYAQAASYQLSQVVYHLTLHHLIEEAFALTTMRQLPQCHPLAALLGHHFAGLMPVNIGTLSEFFGQATQEYLLVGRDGSERLANARYARWNFWQLDFESDLRRRGVDDPALLPYYPFRDDLLLYWDLLRDYTRDYLALYYRCDRDVAEDYELQAWAAELSREDGGMGNVRGLPSRITTFETLHDIVHILVFTAGPHHASLNFSQIEYGGFVPNMPATAYLLPPEGGATEETLLNLMPPAQQAIGQTTMSHQAEYYMGQLLDYASYFCGCWNAGAQDVVSDYRDELLGDVTRTIHRRNEQRLRDGSLPYKWVLPVNVPNSTSS